MAEVDDDDTELNCFEWPEPSAPFASADLAMYVSWGKITYKDLMFVQRNVNGNHTDDAWHFGSPSTGKAYRTTHRIDIRCR